MTAGEEAPAGGNGQEPGHPGPWGLAGALALPAAAFAGQLGFFALIGALASVVLLRLEPNLAEHPSDLAEAVQTVSLLPAMAAYAAFTLALVHWSVSRVHRLTLAEGIGLRPVSAGSAWRHAALGSVIALGGLVLIAAFPPDEMEELGGPLTRLASEGGLGYAAWIVLAVVVSPLVEEVLFRGYAYLGARRRLGPGAAGTLVTVLFVAPHMAETGTYWPPLAGITLLAVALARIMERRRNLTLCIAGHLGYNGSLVLASLVS
ncbi:MAG TPA: CPBP family intramembrane glutamic endopeptidase [Candidatus Polarisedimenticolia bacterium]|nr:CPBP family intramembrane glutamic endopeptidase [Candidatus Polarisedimenticolia bacterium]